MTDETRCNHPLNRLTHDTTDPRGSVCGACGDRLNVRLPSASSPEERQGAPGYDMSIHSNPDARAWAHFFIDTYERTEMPLSEDVMVGWFANAMMAMHDSSTAEARRERERAERDWRRLLLLIAETCGEDDPEAAVADEYDPWEALRRLKPKIAGAEARRERERAERAERKRLRALRHAIVYRSAGWAMDKDVAAAESRAEALAAALRGLATHFTAHHRCPATGDCPDCDAIAAADEVLAGSRAARPLPTSVPGHDQPCRCPTCSRSRGEIGEEEYARRRAAHDESRGGKR